jgi:hypothetical protein
MDFLDNEITTTVTTIYIPNPSNKHIRGTGNDYDEYFETKEAKLKPQRHYIEINNPDNNCLFRALEVGRLRHDRQRIKDNKVNPEDPNLNLYTEWKFRKLTKNQIHQGELAQQLMLAVGITPKTKGYGIDELKKVRLII